jgi:hypothetical protein
LYESAASWPGSTIVIGPASEILEIGGGEDQHLAGAVVAEILVALLIGRLGVAKPARYTPLLTFL